MLIAFTPSSFTSTPHTPSQDSPVRFSSAAFRFASLNVTVVSDGASTPHARRAAAPFIEMLDSFFMLPMEKVTVSSAFTPSIIHFEQFMNTSSPISMLASFGQCVTTTVHTDRHARLPSFTVSRFGRSTPHARPPPAQVSENSIDT